MENVNASDPGINWHERVESLRRKLLDKAPKCPVHGITMEMKSGQNGGLFWGCPKYNDRRTRCLKTRWFGKRETKLSEEMKAASRQSSMAQHT